jgi:hypothetical protein
LVACVKNPQKIAPERVCDGERGIDVQEIAALIERYAKISKTTPARRARTLISWLKWLQAASGAVEERQGKFVLR